MALNTIHSKTYGKVQKLCWLFLCLISIVLFIPNAQAQEVKASIDTTDIRYGEEIKYTISVSLDSVQNVVFPEGQTFAPFETINFYPIDTLTKQRLFELRRTYGITHFDSGAYTLPKQFVLINDKPIGTSTFDVRVHQVEVDTLAQPMYSIKPFLPVKRAPFSWINSLAWVIGIAALAFLIWYLFIKKKGGISLQKKSLPPLEEAIQGFKKLDAADYLQQNNSKEYYSQLTNIVKRYLDREVTQEALESTTDELLLRLNALRDSGRIPFNKDILRELKEVLDRADLIKFAKMRHEQQYVDKDRIFMETMVLETDRILPEEPDDEAKEAMLAKQIQEEKEQKRKRKIWITSLAGVLLLSVFVYGIYHYTTTSASSVFDDSNWIESAYGYPPLIIKTPEVLVRTDAYVFQVPGTKEVTTFTSGKIESPLYIMVESLTKDDGNPPPLENVLDQSINQLENMGAENLLVKVDGFQVDNQANGIKAHGRFNLKSDRKSVRNYELYLIDQPASLYQVLIIYSAEDSELEAIKDRIIESIEFKVSN